MEESVLTLLILEFGFGAKTKNNERYLIFPVLTLLILEFGFGAGWSGLIGAIFGVLTLLILEFGFGAICFLNLVIYEHNRLNPSYTGIWLRGRFIFYLCFLPPYSLNPSYTGIWLRGVAEESNIYHELRVGLNPSYTGIWLRGRGANAGVTPM